ncbi:MAG: molybdopterin molybdotransferase MoeA [Planctomycetota bacterium]|jgi:molybdopterin molybdotransferase
MRGDAGERMVPLEEALARALDAARVRGAKRLPLADAAGLVLAEDARSATDLPPFNRSAMDGYAVRAGDVAEAGAELEVAGTVAAGVAPAFTVDEGRCARIFTGAIVPEGADTVVMQEETEAAGNSRVRFLEPAKPGKNIAWRGEDVRAGDVVVGSGRLLRAAEISLAAAAGVAEVSAIPRPSVAVLSTGNELVPAGPSVSPGEIRDANGPALTARLASADFAPTFLGIARDDPRETRDKIEEGLGYDCLVLSGGVSVGDLDFVPQALRELGVEMLFEKVAMKPGRPIKLGRRGDTLVWGLPGNPVSVLVATELLVLPSLRRMSGVEDCVPRARRGTLTRDYRKKSGRRTFAPARLVEADDEGAPPRVEPVEYHGSGDIAGYSRADAIFTLPAEPDGAEAGAIVEYYLRED